MMVYNMITAIFFLNAVVLLVITFYLLKIYGEFIMPVYGLFNLLGTALMASMMYTMNAQEPTSIFLMVGFGFAGMMAVFIKFIITPLIGIAAFRELLQDVKPVF